MVWLTALAGCSPEVDWREFQWEAGRFQVLLPARPADETREITLGPNGEWQLRLTLFSARVPGAVVAVGYADLPGISNVPGISGIPGPLDAAARLRLLAAARDGFLKNADASASNSVPVALEGQPGAIGLEFRGNVNNAKPGNQPMVIVGRVYATEQRFYQLLYVGPSDHRAAQDLDLFLNSLRLTRPVNAIAQ